MNHIVTDHVLINGTRIAHGIHGEGEPVVLLHGTPSSSYIWRNVVPVLTTNGYKVHVYDLLGYGLSERPWDPTIDTSVTGQVPILEGLLDHWGLKDFHLVSHDIGGGIAVRFTVPSLDRVKTLTLIDVVSFDSWPSKRTRQQMEDGLDTLIKASDSDHHRHFEEWLLSTVQNKDQLRGSALRTYMDFISNPVGQASLFQHQVRHYDAKHTLEFADRLDELGRIPVQVIWGRDDAWQNVSWAYKLTAAIPGSELHVVEDCGHFGMEDQPEEIAALLVDFMNRG